MQIWLHQCMFHSINWIGAVPQSGPFLIQRSAQEVLTNVSCELCPCFHTLKILCVSNHTCLSQQSSFSPWAFSLSSCLRFFHFLALWWLQRTRGVQERKYGGKKWKALKNLKPNSLTLFPFQSSNPWSFVKCFLIHTRCVVFEWLWMGILCQRVNLRQ